MKHVKQAVAEALSQPQIASSKPSQSEKLPQPLLDRLWTKMAEMYGHRWTGSFGVSADQSHAWASALSGLTGQQIGMGLSALTQRGDDWPPSAPEFRKLCKPTPESLGIPALDKAYRKACEIAHPTANREGVHPAVYHAACETGFYELQNLPAEKGRRLFERAYERTVAMIMAGEPLREIPKALPETVSVRTDEGGRAGLAALRAAMKGGVRNG